jgi:excisionase family DNA binding protein
MTAEQKVPQLLTADKVAEILGIPKGHVYALARRGQLPTVRIGPRFVRFDPRDLELWLNRRTTTRPRGMQ